MVFASPLFLWLLVTLPLIALAYFKLSSNTNLQLSLAEPKKKYTSIQDEFLYHLPFIFKILAITMIVVALARPQLGQSYTKSKNDALDIMFAVDTSQSMSALDFSEANLQRDRLDVVKEILTKFINSRVNDRLGLIVFADEAYTQCPITRDHGALLSLVDRLYIGMVGKSTAIGSALALAAKRMRELEAKSKIVILMTDGQNTAGAISPSMASKLARELNIKVYTIGIGRDGAVPFQVNTPLGQRVVNQVISIDENALIDIAEQTGAQYFRARSANELSEIYAEINKLETTELEVQEYNSFKDIYEYFLLAAFLFFLLDYILANTILKRL